MSRLTRVATFLCVGAAWSACGIFPLDYGAGRIKTDAGTNVDSGTPRDGGVFADAGTVRDAGRDLRADGGTPRDAGPGLDGGGAIVDGGNCSPGPSPQMSFFISSEGATAGGRFGDPTLDDGLVKADALCQQLADDAYGCALQATREWRAYLSTSLLNDNDNGTLVGEVVFARDRIGEGPFIDYTGTLIADDVTALHDLGVGAASALTEQGNVVVSTAQAPDLIWTGSDGDGRVVDCKNPGADGGCAHPVSVADTCANWVDNGELGLFGVQGRPGGGPGQWADFSLNPCINASPIPDGGGQGDRRGIGRIYCFAIDPGPEN